MKKIITFIVLTLTLTACYRDLGDYDYHFDQMDEIENVTLIPEPEKDMNGDWVIEFTQPAAGNGIRTEWLKANITHKFENADNYRCHWKYNMPIEKNGILAFRDTTITADSIYVMLPENTNITYEIMLIVEDCSNTPSNGIKQYYSITVNSVPPFKNSLMVLHGTAGERIIGNIDDNKIPAEVIPDAWKQIYGDAPNPFKTAINIFDNSTYHNNGTQEHSLFVATYTGSAYIYNSYGLSPILHNEYWTYPNIEGHNIVPKQIGKYNPEMQCGFMIDQEGLALICGRAFKMQFFEIGANVAEGTEGHITSDEYEAECGILFENYLLLWDKKEGRFLTTYYMGNQFPSITTLNRAEAKMTAPLVDAGIDFTASQYESPKGMKAIYGYISCDGSFFSKTGYMIFINENNQAYAYRIEINDKESSTNAPQTRETEIIARFKVTDRIALSGLVDFTAQSPITYYSQLDPSFFYYASGGTLYRYNMTNRQSTAIYTAPEGYHIDILKFRCATNYSYAGSLTSILDIAMSKDGKGAIATIKLNNSGALDNNFAQQFHTGFGPIADMAFAHDFIYQKVTFN